MNGSITLWGHKMLAWCMKKNSTLTAPPFNLLGNCDVMTLFWGYQILPVAVRKWLQDPTQIFACYQKLASPIWFYTYAILKVFPIFILYISQRIHIYIFSLFIYTSSHTVFTLVHTLQLSALLIRFWLHFAVSVPVL